MEGQLHSGFIVAREKVLYKGDVMVPTSSSITQALLIEYHDSPTGVSDILLPGVSWGNSKLCLATEKVLYKEAVVYIQKCSIGQQQKTLNTSPAGLLHPLQIPTQGWDEISMDFIEGLPLSRACSDRSPVQICAFH